MNHLPLHPVLFNNRLWRNYDTVYFDKLSVFSDLLPQSVTQRNPTFIYCFLSIAWPEFFKLFNLFNSEFVWDRRVWGWLTVMNVIFVTLLYSFWDRSVAVFFPGRYKNKLFEIENQRNFWWSANILEKSLLYNIELYLDDN